MANEKEAGSELEWKIKVVDGSSKTLAPGSGLASRVFLGLKVLIIRLVLKLWRFLRQAWDLGHNDPRKLIHCVKVGMALTIVSLFYYMRPLYEGVGGNAMWAIMTVVVVFENTVGATIYKSLNRIFGTFLAAFLALGVHWVASHAGERSEPFIVEISVFILASTATFSRFIPSVKTRFDYGALIFILTFSLISVSGYRVDELFNMAHHRVSTILIGTSMCIFISMIICPIWAGKELYTLITTNMSKLANSLDGCVPEYFNNSGDSTDNNKVCNKKLLGYKCVLSSKAAEESMANFARWEPAHGIFNFQHPWKQYLKIGASLRSCACCIEALNGFINSQDQVPENPKKLISCIALKLSSNSSSVIKELAITVKKMKKSSKIDFLVGEMNNAVEELQNDLKSIPSFFSVEQQLPEAENIQNEKSSASAPLMEILPLLAFASLLIEIATRVEDTVDAVEELANLAMFKPVADDKTPKNNSGNKILPDHDKEEEIIMTLERV